MAKAKVSIDREACKSCELCIHVCKQGVLAIDSTVLNKKSYSPASVVDPDKCIGCGNCAVMCPDSAITLTRI